MPEFAVFRRHLPAAIGLIALVLGGQAPARDSMQGVAGAYLAARQASVENDYRAGADYAVRALIRDPGNPVLMESAILAYVGMGRIERAFPIARKMQEAGFLSQTARLVSLAESVGRGDFDTVSARMPGNDPLGPLIDGLVKGWSLTARGDVQAAEDAFHDSSRGGAIEYFGYYHKALAHASRGNYSIAAMILGSGTNVGGISSRATMAQIQVASQLGANDRAVALLDQAFGLGMTPQMEALRNRLVAGETVPFDVTPGPREGVAEVFYNIATALEPDANSDFTLLFSRIAEYLDPRHGEAALLSAQLLERLGNPELAIETYEGIGPEQMVFLPARLGRAEAMRRAGDPEGATRDLRGLAAEYPRQLLVQVTLGDILRQRDMFAEATQVYDRAIALLPPGVPSGWVLYYTRGITLERTRQWDRAEADFRKALSLNPGQPDVLNYLGYSLIEMGTNLPEALRMIEQAVAAEPDSGHIVDSLAWGLYRMGRYEEAVAPMERAAELMPVDPIVNDHLGDVYWAVGRKTEARFQWRRALSFDPEPQEAERIRRKLDLGLDAVLAEEGEKTGEEL